MMPNSVKILTCAWLAVAVLLLLTEVSHAQIINSFAGTGTAGFSGDNGLAKDALMNNPYCVRVDYGGNVFVSDMSNHRIRRIAANSNIITTYAGTGTAGYSGEGVQATTAMLRSPRGMYVDTLSNLYIADIGNHRIRKVGSDGIIVTVIGNGIGTFSGDNGPATQASVKNPKMVFGDSNGNIYITDSDNNRIRRVNVNGIIGTIVGTGIMASTGDGLLATNAAINSPSAAAMDSVGNIYIMEYYGNRLRKVTASTGLISTYAGNGICNLSGDGGDATLAGLCTANDLITDNEYVYYTEEEYGIRRVSLATNIITTFAGSGKGNSGNGGPATSATFLYISSITFDSMGDCYLADYNGNNVRKIDFPLPTALPTVSPTAIPSFLPTTSPTLGPTFSPTYTPTFSPTNLPTRNPTRAPSVIPTTTYPTTISPSIIPSKRPTREPTNIPTYQPTRSPSVFPSRDPSLRPSFTPTFRPTCFPSLIPTYNPTAIPSTVPTFVPTQDPTLGPSLHPSNSPTISPTRKPSAIPTVLPTRSPSYQPSKAPSKEPTFVPSRLPSFQPTHIPSRSPTNSPSRSPTFSPTFNPSLSPSVNPSVVPTFRPSLAPTRFPTMNPTFSPSKTPTFAPSDFSIIRQTKSPTVSPTLQPTVITIPTMTPTLIPSVDPTMLPTLAPTDGPNSPKLCTDCITNCNSPEKCGNSCQTCIRSCYTRCIEDCMRQKCSYND